MTDLPLSNLPGVKMTLLAEHPELVTPTGIAVGSDGRIWVAVCHTHFRPTQYVGPENDEIVIFDANGQNRRVFYNKTATTMHLEIGAEGWLYIVERGRVLRVKDTDGDGVGDIEEIVLSLETETTYPHNGLGGMAWHPNGGMIVSIGENFGKKWTLRGQDGKTEIGTGEGGVFWCSADGRQLRRIARGFWNPFGIHVRADGMILAADNDPGSRPPCRLLQVVEGADYGFQYEYGSSAIHPFVAWNGELRGTLGMIHPCGEGPCAVVSLGGGVLVPSWSSHCIDYFPMHWKGATPTADRIELVRGNDLFRPTGMARGPDGSFYINDWVSSSYSVHGLGRLWKLEIDERNADWLQPSMVVPNTKADLAETLRNGKADMDLPQMLQLARSEDPVLADASLTAISKSSVLDIESFRKLSKVDRLSYFVAMRRKNINDDRWVRACIEDQDPDFRFECLRWISDGKLEAFSSDVERILTLPAIEYRQFEAALATVNTLRGAPSAGVTDVEPLIEQLLKSDQSPQLQAFVLRLIPPNHPKLNVSQLELMLASDSFPLKLEVVRTLALRHDELSLRVLRPLIANRMADTQLRADALAGLALSSDENDEQILLSEVRSGQEEVRTSALRSLRRRGKTSQSNAFWGYVAFQFPTSKEEIDAVMTAPREFSNRPAVSDPQAWLDKINEQSGKPSREAGRRVYFHTASTVCSNCHRFEGRGNVVGPDLSMISSQGDRLSILRSIIDPHRDVAPQYFSTLLELEDDTTFAGILLRSSDVDVFRDAEGNERTFKPSDIWRRKELTKSIMPEGIASTMTYSELRDLLAFLSP